MSSTNIHTALPLYHPTSYPSPLIKTQKSFTKKRPNSVTIKLSASSSSLHSTSTPSTPSTPTSASYPFTSLSSTIIFNPSQLSHLSSSSSYMSSSYMSSSPSPTTLSPISRSSSSISCAYYPSYPSTPAKTLPPTSEVESSPNSSPSSTLSAASFSASPKSRLLAAMKEKNFERVWEMVTQGADVNENEGGYSLLHCAAEEGLLHLTHLLVSKGADVNAKDKNGQTPLHRAASHGHLAVADFLVYVGADIAATDCLNQTAEGLASQKNMLDIYYLLSSARKSTASKKESSRPWNVKRQFEEFLREQAKEEKLVRRNEKLQAKLQKLQREKERILMMQEERGKDLSKKDAVKLERLEEKMERVREEHRRNNIDISMGRSANFDKNESLKSQTLPSF